MRITSFGGRGVIVAITVGAGLLSACGGGDVDLYKAVLGRTGMSEYDPKLVSQEVIATCTVEGRPAKLGLVKYSYSMMKLAGLNRRSEFGPMYVAATRDADGSIRTVMADAGNSDQVEGVKNKWVNFWGCKLG